MDFRVGGSSPVGPPSDVARGPQGQIEARLLAVRPTRGKTEGGRRADERRSEARSRDPRSGRVLVLMIPDGQQLPAGIESGGYRVFLRFVRR